MAEQPLYLASPFSSVTLESNSETYFLLPFSSVSTANGNVNIIGAASSDSMVRDVFGDNQTLAALPIDSVHLVSTSDLVTSTGIPVVGIENFALALADESPADFAVPSDGRLMNATAVAVGSPAQDNQDCYYPPDLDQGDETEEDHVLPVEAVSYVMGCGACGFQTKNPVSFREHGDQWSGIRHYRCDICETIFDHIEKLTVHVKQCRVSKPFKCGECDEMFNREINYTVHMATHNLSGKELRCPLCQETFRRLASFRCHLKLHAVDDVLSCATCEEDFATNSELQHHIQVVHTRPKPTLPVNICKQCGAVFKRPLELAEHMITHKKIKETLRTNYKRKKTGKVKTTAGKYACAVCSKTFDKKSTYDRHQLIHTGERPFVCKVCNKSFNQKGALMFHEAKHLPQKPHKCQLCGAGFSQRGNLRTHVKRVHPATVADSDSMLECPMCSCWFKSSQSLQAHLAKRHKEHLCAIGNHPETVGDPGTSTVGVQLSTLGPALPSTSTSTTSDAAVQKRTAKDANVNNSVKKKRQTPRTTENQRIDDITDFSLAQPGVRRIEGSDGQKWQCEYCEKTFGKLSDLTRHLRTHTGERPFACEMCPQRFALRTTLNKHLRSKHLQLKSARCYICWKELSNSFTLANHMRIHARETVDCEHCSKKFRTKSDLRRHAKKAHPGLADGKKKEEPTAAPKLRQPLLQTETGVVELVEKGSSNDVRTMPLVDETGNLVRPYSCPYCPLRFKKRSHVEEHTRSHENSRPYICQFGMCRKKFFSASALRDHALIHSGVRKHICDVCKKAFLTRRSLGRHLIVHSDLRPFICPYCGKRFKRGVLCRQHIKTHKADAAVVEGGSEGRSNEVAAPATAASTWTATSVPVIHEANAIDHNGQEMSTACNVWGNIQHDPFSNNVDSNAGLARTEEQQLHVPAQEYLAPDPNFLNDSQSGLNSFLGVWDPLGGNMTPNGMDPPSQSLLPPPTMDCPSQPTLTPSAMDCLSQSLLAPAPPLLQTPDIVGLAMPMATERVDMQYPSSVVCELCSMTFQDGLQLEAHSRAVHCQQAANYNIGILPQSIGQQSYQPSSHRVDYTEQPQMNVSSSVWGHTSNQQVYSCPQCGQHFQKAIYLTRHVFEAHPNATASTATSGSMGQVITHAAPSIQGYFPGTTGDVPNPTDMAHDGYGHVVGEHRVGLNMTGQIPVAQINAGSNVYGIVSYARPPVQTTDDGAAQSSSGKLRICPCCGKSFKKPSDLVRHIRTHTDERPYVCGECGRAFKVKTALASHRQTHDIHNRGIMHRCQVCNKIMASRGALKVHLRQHTNEKAMRCPQCVSEFRSVALLRQHLVRSHGVDPQQTAAMTFQPVPNVSALNSGEPSAFTQVVPQNIGPPSLLDTDRLALTLMYNASNEIQLNVRRLSADFDPGQESGYILEVGFLRQLMSQGPGVTLSIPFTEGTTETSISVDPAALLEQGMHENPQVVNGGSQSATTIPSSRLPEPATPSAFLTGVTTFENELDFEQQTETISTQERSQETNEAANFIVECKICDLKFSTIQESRIHFQSADHETAMCLQMEADGPMHMCETCGKMFVTRIRLMRHIRSHTGERPFQCTVCGECFNQSNSLKKHFVSKHTGERPFACPCCDRRFTLKYNMETHVRRVHAQAGTNENVVAVDGENSNQRVRTYLLSL